MKKVLSMMEIAMVEVGDRKADYSPGYHHMGVLEATQIQH